MKNVVRTIAARYVTNWLLAPALIVLVAGCAAPRSRGDSTPSLRLLGDSALGDLSQSLVNAYEAKSGTGSVTFAEAERSQILASLRHGDIDAALLLHPTDDRAVFVTAIGFEALAVVTSPGLPVDSLSGTDLQAIFSGRITNWADVGGPDLPIQPIVPFAGKSERVAFEALALHGQPVGSSALLAARQSQLTTLIHAADGRVGIVAMNQISVGMKTIPIGGAQPPSAAGQRGSYPLIVSVVLTAPSEPEGEAKSFLDWILGEDGQRIVSHYVMSLN